MYNVEFRHVHDHVFFQFFCDVEFFYIVSVYFLQPVKKLIEHYHKVFFDSP